MEAKGPKLFVCLGQTLQPYQPLLPSAGRDGVVYFVHPYPLDSGFAEQEVDNTIHPLNKKEQVHKYFMEYQQTKPP